MHLHISAQLVDLLLHLGLLGFSIRSEHGDGCLLLCKLCVVLLCRYTHLQSHTSPAPETALEEALPYPYPTVVAKGYRPTK